MTETTPPKRIKLNELKNLLDLTTQNSIVLQRFTEFAFKIGCEIVGDEIICDDAQREQLIHWWREIQ